MSSGCVVGTISTTICGPASASKAASLAIRFCDSTAVSVPVRSMTRSDSGGTATSGCAAAPSAAAARSSSSQSCRNMRMVVSYLDAGFSKLTAGGVEICASLATVKLGLTA